VNWDAIWLEVLARLEGDATVASILGDRIYLWGDREFEVPSMTALLVVDTEDENWAPADWQFDIYARTFEDVVAVERAVRASLDRDWPIELGGHSFWTELVEARRLEGPSEDQIYRRSLDFRFTPARSLRDRRGAAS